MTIGDIDKWISGETDVFFDTRATLPSVSADSNPGAKGSFARLSVQKFGHPAIMAVVGAFTAVAWISSVSFMQHSAEPYSILDANSQPSDDGATSGRAPGSETLSTPITSPPRKVIEAQLCRSRSSRRRCSLTHGSPRFCGRSASGTTSA